jgi:hypothetical protein
MGDDDREAARARPDPADGRNALLGWIVLAE